MVKIAHVTLFTLRTIFHNLEDRLKVNYNALYFTAAKSYIKVFPIQNNEP